MRVLREARRRVIAALSRGGDTSERSERLTERNGANAVERDAAALTGNRSYEMMYLVKEAHSD
jgi:hypothetical protein